MPNYLQDHSQSLRGEKGFTLVELIAVSLLLSMLSFVLYGTLEGIIDSRQNILDRSNASSTARVVFERMTRELSNNVFGIFLSEAKDSKETANANSDQGNNRSRGQRSKFEGNKDSIRFVAVEAAQAAYGARENHGAVEISYKLVKSPEDKEIESDKPTYTLIREEVPADVKNKKIRESRKVIFPVASGISSLSFRYWKEDSIVEDWKENTTPFSLEITINILGKDGANNRYRTAVNLRKKPKKRAQATSAGPR